MKVNKSFLLIIIYCILLTACTGNVKNAEIDYSRNPDTSDNADITISIELKNIPSEIETLYFENIQFFYQNEWPGIGVFESDDFDFFFGNETRFAFERVGTTNIFSLTVKNGLLRVDEWVKHGACPFEKVALQGFYSPGVDDDQLPNVLDIPFPCNLDNLTPKKDFTRPITETPTITPTSTPTLTITPTPTVTIAPTLSPTATFTQTIDRFIPLDYYRTYRIRVWHYKDSNQSSCNFMVVHRFAKMLDDQIAEINVSRTTYSETLDCSRWDQKDQTYTVNVLTGEVVDKGTLEFPLFENGKVSKVFSRFGVDLPVFEDTHSKSEQGWGCTTISLVDQITGITVNAEQLCLKQGSSDFYEAYEFEMEQFCTNAPLGGVKGEYDYCYTID